MVVSLLWWRGVCRLRFTTDKRRVVLFELLYTNASAWNNINKESQSTLTTQVFYEVSVVAAAVRSRRRQFSK